MLKVEWSVDGGWGAPAIVPSGPVGLHPFAHVFHYAVECYEGMKAYVDSNDRVRLYRPQMNMERFRTSAGRMSLPDFNGGELLKCIERLVEFHLIGCFASIPRGLILAMTTRVFEFHSGL